MEYKFLTAGERCITVSFGDEVSLELNRKVRAFYEALQKDPFPGMVEAVPTYCAVSVHYRPETIRRKELERLLAERLNGLKPASAESRTEKKVPVFYGGETGPDLEECARIEGVSAEELIRRHTEHPYYVFQLGFSPGHPYMARFEEPFSFKRRETPRVNIPEHSVVAQTGLTNITPFPQACGWNILGNTPINITDYYREEPFYFKAGDWVRLCPIDRAEYERLKKENVPRPEPPVLCGEREGILVESPGARTTVQDEGRYGYQAYGVSPAGPMDHRAFHLANLLVGNRHSEAALELTMTGPALRFMEDAMIAVTGADLSPTLEKTDSRGDRNADKLPMYTPVRVKTGDVLRFGRRKNGCRAYISVAGGIRVPEVLGSRSTDLKNRLGGYEGRALKTGDRIPIGKTGDRIPIGKTGDRIPIGKPDARTAGSRPADRITVPVYPEKEIALRVVRGPQEDKLTKKALRSFFHYSSVVTDKSDRQGIRLDREPLEFVTDSNIISDGIPQGAIQVPGDGKPIVLLSDRQSVGGYTKIGTVIYADLPLLAQVMPGCRVRFVEVSQELAEDLYLKEIEFINRLEKTYVQC